MGAVTRESSCGTGDGLWFASERASERVSEREAANYHPEPSLLPKQRKHRRLNEIPEDASMQSADPGFRHPSLSLPPSLRSLRCGSQALAHSPDSFRLLRLPAFPVLNFVRSRREEAIKRTLTRRGTREERLSLSLFSFTKTLASPLLLLRLLSSSSASFFLSLPFAQRHTHRHTHANASSHSHARTQ